MKNRSSSALFEAGFYSASEWLYREQLQESPNEDARLMRAVSLLLGERRNRKTAIGLLESLLEENPSSLHRAIAQSFIAESKRLEGTEKQLREARRQLEELRKIDLEPPP